MASLGIHSINKLYGKTLAMRGADFEEADGNFCVAQGRSGCGKSTVLPMIAGPEDIISGEISIDGRVAAAIGLRSLLVRSPSRLSRGRQRVAMGPAIVRSPGVLLFDEPLSDRDAELRIRVGPPRLSIEFTETSGAGPWPAKSLSYT